MAAASATNYVMTPPLLTQLWKLYGGSARVASLTVFSQLDTSHAFSNYSRHPCVTMDIPCCCNPAALANSGRATKISFDFAEKAIMACKAALFQDYSTLDEILKASDSKQAKRLGRRVSPFDQQVWDANQCTIVRHVMVAKLQWNTFRSVLLQTGDDTIAECTIGDWVWGTALDASDPNVFYPGRWTALNILGWSLMEARDEAQQQMNRLRQQQQQQQLQLHQLAPLPPPPPPPPPSAPPASMDSAKTKGKRKEPSGVDRLDPNSIKYLGTLYSFGANAFGPLNQSNDYADATAQLPDLSHLVKSIVEASFSAARNMRGERGRKYVTKMLTDIYHRGLFMHGGANSSVNRTIIPAFRHIISELNKLDSKHKKRVSIVKDLAEACQDCQQVQARVILRLYGDLTSQNETLESQLKYSLVRIKEAALQILITKYHSPSCDYDHTRVGPEHQRAHLFSGYVTLIGDEYGLDGVTAANGDRFLDGCLGVIRNAYNLSNNKVGRNSGTDRFRFGKFGRGGSGKSIDDQKLKDSLMAELTGNLCVKEWLSGLIGDINNQSLDADRMIDRSCIFAWASANMQGDFKHRIFYDDARSIEYSDLDPKEPTNDNQFEPFLSPIVLVEMLIKVGMLTPKSSRN